MILGIGTDLTDINRIEKLMDKFKERFVSRCFTSHEQVYAESRRGGGLHMASYAKRFAAKEACAKALGTGFGESMAMKEIGVLNNEAGQPLLKLTGGALARLEELTPKGMSPVMHLSLTDEPPLVQAFVIIEAIPSSHRK